MKREYYVYTRADGTCVLKTDEEEATLEFSDVLEAIDFVHKTRPSGPANLTVYACDGKWSRTPLQE